MNLESHCALLVNATGAGTKIAKWRERFKEGGKLLRKVKVV